MLNLRASAQATLRHLQPAAIAALVLGCIAGLLQPIESRAQQAPAAEPLQVLFIGNSYTYVNDLPSMLGELAASHDVRPVKTKTIGLPGGTLQAHWEKAAAVAAIQQTQWDFVVLQEQSMLPTVDPERMYRYARLFDAEIKKRRARTILFLTWARVDKPGMQRALDTAYTTLANELGSIVAPVGPAWQKALTERTDLGLHHQDGSHPTRLGTYVAACVFYSVIYGKPPERSPRLSNAGPLDAALAHRAAWDAVKAPR